MNPDKSELGLTTIRRNRGVSLEQIARDTKISLRNLRAIEEGDFGKLPGGIYNTSYIKQYARAIDFDENLLLDYYQRKMFPDAGRNNSQDGKGKKGWVGGYPRSATSLL